VVKITTLSAIDLLHFGCVKNNGFFLLRFGALLAKYFLLGAIKIVDVYVHAKQCVKYWTLLSRSYNIC
jgi:hypothetical protein